MKKGSHKGFTLLEVMVALVIGTVMIGGVMGMISATLRHSFKVNEKSRILPVLEAAAQEILAKPEKAAPGFMTPKAFSDAPTVKVALTRVFDKEEGLGTQKSQLFRVELSHRGHLLEFSLLIPQP